MTENAIFINFPKPLTRVTATEAHGAEIMKKMLRGKLERIEGKEREDRKRTRTRER